jgi:hypothetical protein
LFVVPVHLSLCLFLFLFFSSIKQVSLVCYVFVALLFVSDQHALEDINVCCANLVIILKNISALMRETPYQDDGNPRSRIIDIDNLVRLAGTKLKELFQKFDVMKKEIQ